MTDKLKPCPFCGAKLKGDRWGIFEHEANECILAHYEVYDEDADKWNTRKPMDRIVEQLEEEIEYCEKQVDKISATSFSIVNGLKRNIYIEKISAYRDAIEIVKEGGKDVTTRNDTGMD